MTPKDKDYEKRTLIREQKEFLSRARRLNNDPAFKCRELSVAITNAETSLLWVAQIKTQPGEVGTLDF